MSQIPSRKFNRRTALHVRSAEGSAIGETKAAAEDAKRIARKAVQMSERPSEVRLGRDGLGWWGLIRRGDVDHSTSGKSLWQLAKFFARSVR